jgi:enoyl-CoA hydratase/carnithine racemase
MSDSDVVKYEVKRKYAEITLERPPVNAFDITLMKGLYNALVKADDNPKVRCVLIKSRGKLFSAGIDTKWMMSGQPLEVMKEFGEITQRKLPLKLLLMKKPVVCMVHGTAIGYGMIVLMASDLRIFADRPIEEMFLKMPEVELSMPTGAGSSFLPVLTFGISFAKSIMFTSDKFSVKDLPPGYATRVFPLETIESETEKFMQELSKRKESVMYLLKAKMTLHNKKYIERCFDLEQEVMQLEQTGRKSMQEWDEYIQDLFKKYP